jgi:glycerol-3-phosphate acyltransferase PlsX
MRVALDAMGGDSAPEATVAGALDVVQTTKDVEIVLVGNETLLRRELASSEHSTDRITVVHASEVITMDDPPAQFVRRKKDSSLRKVVEMVKEQEADAAVSAGNSGAMMALAFILLGRAEEVERPAIATEMPSFQEPFLLLDAGANVDCTAENLVQFALMGDAYCRLARKIEKPRIGLLSIGEEPTKGNELTKETFKLLEKTGSINFIGNIESKDAYLGSADVVVCDGFVGNIFLKTSEGLAEVIMKMIKREIYGSSVGKLGYLMVKSALKNFRKKVDYSEYGGAPLLGINGSCFISHGRSNANAIKNAILKASEFASKRVFKAISGEIKTFHDAEKRKVAAG